MEAVGYSIGRQRDSTSRAESAEPRDLSVYAHFNGELTEVNSVG